MRKKRERISEADVKVSINCIIVGFVYLLIHADSFMTLMYISINILKCHSSDWLLQITLRIFCRLLEYISFAP